MDAVTLEAVMHFAVSMFEQGLSSATIANKLVAHFFASKADGFPDPYSDFTIRRALQDWAKGQSRTGEMRMPVFPLGLSQLLAVLPVVCHSDYEVLLFKASFLSAGGGGGRVASESVWVARFQFDSSRKALRFTDLQWVSRGMQIRIRHSKADQLGRGQVVSLIRAAEGHCPYLVLWLYLSEQPPGMQLLTGTSGWLTFNQISI